ncbi:MAG: outer membrane protein assembly factor BamB [Gammaproteobacteria bacterium]|nr:outer membrane protein assembly factor BamB [Gammaproteobacteria bacterium]
MRRLLILPLAALLALGGCSKDKDAEQPAKLVVLAHPLPVRELWHVKVGGGKHQMLLRLGLGPAVADGVAFAASDKGIVEAVDVASGRRLWRRPLRLPLSAGPGVGEGLVVLGSSKGDLVALDAKSGRERWRVRTDAELLSTPAIGQGLVVARSVDGRLRAFDATTGAQRWSVEQPVPKLSLRGIATPVIAKDAVVSGFDNGKIMAVNLVNGNTLWETTLEAPHGRTELERLVDVDCAVVVDGDNVYAAGYHGRTAQLALGSGQIWWAHDMSSDHGLAVAGDVVYVAEADGTLIALHAADGSEIWHNSTLKWRGLSAPVVTPSAVVVGDYQGYLHWFDRKDGKIIARARDSKFRISSAPIAVGDRIVVLSDGGELAAFRAAAPAG